MSAKDDLDRFDKAMQMLWSNLREGRLQVLSVHRMEGVEYKYEFPKGIVERTQAALVQFEREARADLVQAAVVEARLTLEELGE